MKLQIFSDIHMEGYRDPAILWKFVTPQAPVAIVAGENPVQRYDYRGIAC